MGLHTYKTCVVQRSTILQSQDGLGMSQKDQPIWSLKVQHQLSRGVEDQQHCQQKFRANAAPPDSQKHTF